MAHETDYNVPAKFKNKPGVRRRIAELQGALKEAGHFSEDEETVGRGITGGVHVRQQVARARRNLDRLVKALKERG